MVLATRMLFGPYTKTCTSDNRQSYVAHGIGHVDDGFRAPVDRQRLRVPLTEPLLEYRDGLRPEECVIALTVRNWVMFLNGGEDLRTSPKLCLATVRCLSHWSPSVVIIYRAKMKQERITWEKRAYVGTEESHELILQESLVRDLFPRPDV